jgi:hypothetical protein
VGQRLRPASTGRDLSQELAPRGLLRDPVARQDPAAARPEPRPARPRGTCRGSRPGERAGSARPRLDGKIERLRLDDPGRRDQLAGALVPADRAAAFQPDLSDLTRPGLQLDLHSKTLARPESAALTLLRLRTGRSDLRPAEGPRRVLSGSGKSEGRVESGVTGVGHIWDTIADRPTRCGCRNTPERAFPQGWQDSNLQPPVLEI